MVNLYKVGRNDPCPCGSGKKFKKCCLDAQRPNASSELDVFDPQAQDIEWSALERGEEPIPAYDPFTGPDVEQWLALDEQERIDLVSDYHRRARIRPPSPQVHATIHAVVESQIADAELPVRRVLQRLMSEGLDRHDAIHAIGSVLISHINDLMRESRSGGSEVDSKSGRDPNERYFAELEALTAEGWRRSYE
jgi:hypothetical protein